MFSKCAELLRLSGRVFVLLLPLAFYLLSKIVGAMPTLFAEPIAITEVLDLFQILYFDCLIGMSLLVASSPLASIYYIYSNY